LDLRYLHWLESLNGLSSLTTVGNDLTIINNTELVDLIGLEALSAVGNNRIRPIDPILKITAGSC
jgi:hypothetical protein